ncbi:MAG: hypothetical protein SGBAC_008122 [Bacillariaceae sp.]
MVSVSRESFSARYNGSPAGMRPPGKVRKTSKDRKEDCSSVFSSAYFTCTKLGFGVNEFLPLVPNQEDPKVTEHTSSSLNIDTLSDDVLGKCFFNGYLDTFETLKLTLLNKRTRRVGLTQIQHLDLRKCKNLTVDEVSKISLVHQNLQVGRGHLVAIADASKNLRHLVLRGTAVNDRALIEYLKEVQSRFGECQLETLDLSAVSKKTSQNIGDTAAEVISEYCPNMKCLKLGWCKNLTDKGVESISKLGRLRELDLSLTGITVESCYILLETLGPHLEVLDLSATPIFEVFDSKDPSGWITFSKLRKLTTLKLQFCEQLSATFVVDHIVQNAASLKSIDVKHSGQEGTILFTKEQGCKLHARNIHIAGATIMK